MPKKKSPFFNLPNFYSNLKGKLSGFVNFLWSSYKSWILPRFKYRDFNKSINNRLDVHTANVYRDLRIPYREIRVRRFLIYGDCMLPTIPVIFEISTSFVDFYYLLFFMIFFSNFLTIFAGISGSSNLHKFHMHVMGYPVQHRDLLYFLYGKNLQWIEMAKKKRAFQGRFVPEQNVFAYVVCMV